MSHDTSNVLRTVSFSVELANKDAIEFFRDITKYVTFLCYVTGSTTIMSIQKLDLNFKYTMKSFETS